VKKIALFDAHCDCISRFQSNAGDTLAKSSGHLDLERVSGFAPYAQFFALFADSASRGPAMWERYLALLKQFRSEVDTCSDRMVHCRTAEEACLAGEQGKIAAFLSVEGGELLDCDPEKLDIAYADGVRAVNVTWNHANALSGSHKDCPEQGLTQQDVCFVRRMRQLGILIDVSHISDPGFWDVLECAPGPIVATHSNARSVFFHTRNLTDEQITAIIENRGVIGLNLFVDFMGTQPTSVETVVAHLEHILELGGENTVALGGDWDGAEPLVGGFNDISDWRVFFEELLRRNYSEELIQKLFYFNMMRIVREVCST